MKLHALFLRWDVFVLVEQCDLHGKVYIEEGSTAELRQNSELVIAGELRCVFVGAWRDRWVLYGSSGSGAHPSPRLHDAWRCSAQLRRSRRGQSPVVFRLDVHASGHGGGVDVESAVLSEFVLC